MKMHIREWMNSPAVLSLKKESKGKMYTELFFRDPIRPTYFNNDLMYSPADGTILYAKEFNPNNFLEIKGKDFTVKDLLGIDDFNERAIVVGIFMTSYDVHTNRVPCDAIFVESKFCEVIQTHNMSMTLLEENLFYDFGYKKDQMSYLFQNQKKTSVFHSNMLGQRFYIVQVADKDINTIITYDDQKRMRQCSRFGQVRYGSQVDFALPLNKKFDYEILVKKLDHIEAGLDPIIKIWARSK